MGSETTGVGAAGGGTASAEPAGVEPAGAEPAGVEPAGAETANAEPTALEIVGVEIVSGRADETEVTALVAASLAVAAAAQPVQVPERAQTGEWVMRARCGGTATSPFPGARSRSWQWSLHP
ncbi:MAG: hypothetical protein LPK38_01845 [Actinomycetes bacterium]|nr:hypothetical protein [Actinomycetes bacterium]MDX5398615.1 hypothetical protein [Actinomycetes bacterium]MDX5449762.1 hypothetical protein [Actinomycetes bacterium]